MKRKRRSWERPARKPTVTRPGFDQTAFRRGLGHGIVVLPADSNIFAGDPERRTIYRDHDRHGRLA